MCKAIHPPNPPSRLRLLSSIHDVPVTMGCSISRPELRGRGKEPSLLSFKHNLDDVSRRDRSTSANNGPSLSAKFLIKQIVGRKCVSLEKKDYVLGGSNELLLPEKEGLKDPPSFHLPNERAKHDPPAHGHGATKKSSDSDKTENARAEAVKQTKTNNHEGNGEELKERGVVIPKFDGPLWISSPSFRDYCIVVPDGDSDDDNSVIAKGNNDPQNRSNREHITHFITKDIEITQDGHSIQRDDSPGRSVKRRINFRKVLTMHRQARVRNFFSVATCYNPLAPSSHNGPRKPHAKTV